MYPESNEKHTLRHKKEDQSQNRCIKSRLWSSLGTSNMQRMRNNTLRLQNLSKAEENYSINELVLLGVVWALDDFKQYLLGHHFTVQIDHRALLSILKERTSKSHQSRLTKWDGRLIPFHLNLKHIAGTQMGLADYMFRNPSEPAKPPSICGGNFIIAQIDIIQETLHIIQYVERSGQRNSTITNRPIQGKLRATIPTTLNQIPWNCPTFPIKY